MSFCLFKQVYFMKRKFSFLVAFILLNGFGQLLAQISPSLAHPQYWSYNGEDILLLGGSVEDNLFQIDTLVQHLELLQSVGGNYVRNTMSSRDPGNEWPFARRDDGKYDLNKFNTHYWDKFEVFLMKLARETLLCSWKYGQLLTSTGKTGI